MFSESLKIVKTNNNPGKAEISKGEFIYNDAIKIKIANVILRAKKKSSKNGDKGIIINPRMKIIPNAKRMSVFFNILSSIRIFYFFYLL